MTALSPWVFSSTPSKVHLCPLISPPKLQPNLLPHAGNFLLCLTHDHYYIHTTFVTKHNLLYLLKVAKVWPSISLSATASSQAVFISRLLCLESFSLHSPNHSPFLQLSSYPFHSFILSLPKRSSKNTNIFLDSLCKFQ